jgi:prepilin-type N-terminal cleavage/methylation domain-containing protein
MKNNKNEIGFTLVEMSAVLAIIGLLIGAVVKGQEMIYQSNIKATIRQWDETKTAMNFFREKFNALPGDYDAASGFVDPSATDGDDDGIIEIRNGGTGAGSREMVNTWEHLRLAGFIGAYNEDGIDGRMKGKLDDTEFWMLTDEEASPNTRPQDGYMNDGFHYIYLRKSYGLNTPSRLDDYNTLQAITYKHARQIDIKYDKEEDEVYRNGTRITNKGDITYRCYGNRYSISSWWGRKDSRVCYMQLRLDSY